MFVALSVAVYVLFIPIDGPWLALTMRGLAIAFVLAFLLTPCQRWVVSGCLGASVLLSSPSFFGEQFSVPAAGLAVVAAVLSAFTQLTGEAQSEIGGESL